MGDKTMMLLTKANKKALPDLYATDGIANNDKICQVKFFNPCGSWTWYAVEFDRIERIQRAFGNWYRKRYVFHTKTDERNTKLSAKRYVISSQ
jgi:hypothetical protein